MTLLKSGTVLNVKQNCDPSTEELYNCYKCLEVRLIWTIIPNKMLRNSKHQFPSASRPSAPTKQKLPDN